MGKISEELIGKLYDIKIKELQFALLDVLEGKNWWDIKYDTGFSDDKCKELKDLVTKTFKEVGEEWKETI